MGYGIGYGMGYGMVWVMVWYGLWYILYIIFYILYGIELVCIDIGIITGAGVVGMEQTTGEFGDNDTQW